ncbi:MerR family transcriptional regulator [Kribbella jiaozuonensis]|uniref:MerR family transcriptional regulator n=1 Tax=Kribbella jiaozuonensis TaxID=2575441 RepID=A0A4U3M3T6_9ACTN|nr:MerR family transcriptional regulator [Kribbella jiaozuonensis]TKK83020.1 MerR family transcriptional regulator [Kribbella jiaozuonensis]
MHAGLTIGEFATLTHLSVRTLRRYHESGLLVPATVDATSGYRYYAAAQIPSAQVIHRLRQLDVPLAEVKQILATDDPLLRADLVAAHLRRLEDTLDRTRAAVVSLRTLLRTDNDELPVSLRSVPARTVAAIRGTVGFDGVHQWYAAAMAELDAAFSPDERTGPPAGRYANELFTHGSGELTVFHPVREPRTSGRIEVVELPAVELAIAVHAGPHDDIDVTYGRLGSWATTHTMTVAGPVHETYLVGPRDTNESAQWRTEIGWPIFRLTPG